MECPICQKSLGGLSEAETQRHVNQCLDGGGADSSPSSAPPTTTSLQEIPSVTVTSSSSAGGGNHDATPPPRQQQGFDPFEDIIQQQQQNGTGAASLSASRCESGTVTPGAPTLRNGNSSNNTGGAAKEPSFSAAVSPVVPSRNDDDAMETNIDMLQDIMPQLPREAALQLLMDCDNNAEVAAATLIELAYGASAMTPHEGWHDTAPDPSSFASSNASNSAPRAGKKKKEPNVEPTTSTVELVVYDLAPDSIGKKVGMGAYHSGVHAYGREFSFGGSFDMANDAGRSGIFHCRPYTAMPNLKKKVLLGSVTGVTFSQLWQTCEELGKDDWRVDDYHMLNKNCNHFTDMFLRRLSEFAVCVAPPPPSADEKDADKTDEVVEWDSLSEEEQKKKIKETFKLPNWINRAASVGSKVVPEFIYKKMLQKLAPPGSTFEAPSAADGKKKDKKKKDGSDESRSRTPTPPPSADSTTRRTPTVPASQAQLSHKDGYPMPPPPPTSASPTTPLPSSACHDPNCSNDGLSPQDTKEGTEMIDTLIAVTQVDRDQAVTLLAKHRWDLDRAVNACF